MPGGHVGDANGRVGLVDVLAAGAGGAVGVDAQVLVVDLDLNRLVDQRRHVDLRERRVTTLLRVERRDPDQAVDAALGGEQAVGVLALGDEGRRLDARPPRPRRPPSSRRRSRGARPSAGTCAAASRPSPGSPCRRRRSGRSRPRRPSRTRRRTGAPPPSVGQASPRPRRAASPSSAAISSSSDRHLGQLVEVGDVGLERAEGGSRRSCARLWAVASSTPPPGRPRSPAPASRPRGGLPRTRASRVKGSPRAASSRRGPARGAR